MQTYSVIFAAGPRPIIFSHLEFLSGLLIILGQEVVITGYLLLQDNKSHGVKRSNQMGPVICYDAIINFPRFVPLQTLECLPG